MWKLWVVYWNMPFPRQLQVSVGVGIFVGLAVRLALYLT